MLGIAKQAFGSGLKSAARLNTSISRAQVSVGFLASNSAVSLGQRRINGSLFPLIQAAGFAARASASKSTGKAKTVKRSASPSKPRTAAKASGAAGKRKAKAAVPKIKPLNASLLRTQQAARKAVQAARKAIQRAESIKRKSLQRAERARREAVLKAEKRARKADRLAAARGRRQEAARRACAYAKLKAQRAKKAEKPKRARPAFAFFVAEQIRVLKKQQPNKPVTELMKAVAAAWKSLPDDKKQRYVQLAEADKQRSQLERKAYEALHPKRPLSAYAAFVKENVRALHQREPGTPASLLLTRVAQEWNALPEKAKEEWRAKAKELSSRP